MTGRTSFAGFGHLPQFLLQIPDFVTQTCRKLELELLGRRMHLVGKLTDKVGEILCLSLIHI